MGGGGGGAKVGAARQRNAERTRHQQNAGYECAHGLMLTECSSSQEMPFRSVGEEFRALSSRREDSRNCPFRFYPTRIG